MKHYQLESCDVHMRAGPRAEWTIVESYSGESTAGKVSLDVSTLAAGKADVQVRFRYCRANWEWHWAIDNVTVIGTNR